MGLYRCFAQFTLGATLVVTGLLRPALVAQEATKPVAIVSIAPLDRLLKDTSYLLTACNVPEVSGIVNLMVNQYSQGIDRARPIGVFVTLNGPMPSPMVCLPMTSRERFFKALESMGIEPEDIGDGLFEVDANGQTLYAKHVGEWMYVAQMEDAFATLPGNPSELLTDLPDRYDVAMRLNVQAFPEDLRNMAMEQMRIGFERGMEQQGNQTPEERELAEQMGRAQIQQIEQLMTDTQQVIVGWTIDSAEQKVYLDAAAQFVEGSKLAQQADSMAALVSDFTAFALPGSSANFRVTSKIEDETDKAVAKQNLRNSLTQLEKQIDNSGNMPEEFASLLKELLASWFSVTEKTIDEGVFDGAASLSVADGTLRALVGGHIADGRALEQGLKDFVAGLPKTANVPTVDFNYGEYSGFALHRVTAPIKIADPAAKKVFGDSLNIVVAASEKEFVIALDPAGDTAVKAAIDAVGSKRAVKATPMNGTIRFEQILRFAQSISPNPILDNAVQTIENYAGKDSVSVTSTVLPRGGIYRMTIDEGVLRTIGVAAKSGNPNGGF